MKLSEILHADTVDDRHDLFGIGDEIRFLLILKFLTGLRGLFLCFAGLLLEVIRALYIGALSAIRLFSSIFAVRFLFGSLILAEGRLNRRFLFFTHGVTFFRILFRVICKSLSVLRLILIIKRLFEFCISVFFGKFFVRLIVRSGFLCRLLVLFIFEFCRGILFIFRRRRLGLKGIFLS